MISTGGVIFVAVVIALIAGAALCGLAVFLFFFYRSIHRLIAVADAVYQLIQPLAGGDSLAIVLKDVRKAIATGKDVSDAMLGFNKTMAEFMKLLQQGTAETVSPNAKMADEIDLTNKESFFVAPTEPEQAMDEAIRDARSMGIPVDGPETTDSEPPLEGMRGSEV
jgi:hypothetical protein